jgi:hypothetical protein
VNIASGLQCELQESKENGAMRLHHVGFVVNSILDEIANLAESSEHSGTEPSVTIRYKRPR